MGSGLLMEGDMKLFGGDSELSHRIAPLVVRLIVGPVFLSEGLQKLLYPALRGPGRFAHIGFPHPELLAYTVAVFEMVCGLLIVLGLATRLAAVPTAVVMIIAITTTKIPIFLGHGFGPFGVRDARFYGFLAMAHEMRTDWAMLLGSILLVIIGGGAWSLDAVLEHRPSSPAE
jgi:uncharacterized membrane protein YphA (DoxX/SURF4 family)